MTDAKIIPDLEDQELAPYWAATVREELVVQRCTRCGALRWPVQGACPECLFLGWEFHEVQPTGTLRTYAVYHRAFDPAFADEIPYAVGYIQLDDGPRMYGIVRGGVTDADIDGPVHAVFEPVIEGAAFVRWRVGA